MKSPAQEVARMQRCAVRKALFKKGNTLPLPWQEGEVFLQGVGHAGKALRMKLPELR